VKAGKGAKNAASVPATAREEVHYVLRLWRDGPRHEDWRASLKDIDSKEVSHFKSLEALVNYLAARNFKKAKEQED
jgi:hypothetical protein